ncbi:MAG: DUF1080 domain-containing protein [Limisphaerales bacterium]
MKTLSLSAWRGAFALLLASACVVWGAGANQLSSEEKGAGWRLLFDGQTTGGWRSFKKQTFPAKGWAVEDGWLHCLGKGGGDIISEAEFEEFDLSWEWKIGQAGNSGVKYFIIETRPSAIGHEYQMLDDALEPDARRGDGKHVTASFYDVLKPMVALPLKPAGEINFSRILVQGNHVEHWLNGTKVLEYELGSEAVKAAVAQSKFKNVAGFGTRIKGHILLQDHTGEVSFRNIKIRDLSAKP